MWRRREARACALGAKVPILLTSRADDEGARLFSCAVAVLYAALAGDRRERRRPRRLAEAPQ